tara:strand:+ start:1876 stop:2328 length:453 start_codon:yes stop_codon:yes gene_type:complete
MSEEKTPIPEEILQLIDLAFEEGFKIAKQTGPMAIKSIVEGKSWSQTLAYVRDNFKPQQDSGLSEILAELEGSNIYYALEGGEYSCEDVDLLAEEVASNFLGGATEGIATIEQFRKLPPFYIRVTDNGDGVNWEYVDDWMFDASGMVGDD